MTRLLLIEDDPIMGESLIDRFRLEGFEPALATTVREAAALLDEASFDAVVSDVRLPDGTGEALFETRKGSGDAPPWLFITAYASVDRAVAMLQAGARDYVTKPFDIADLVEKVRSMIPESDAAGRHPAAVRPHVLGISEAMGHLAAQAERVAARAQTILITGESGSGKEVLARHIHALAPDGQNAPFVAVNCGAIPESLIEAALFGHERGAFTGADRQRRGYLEQADGGTLFLDEIAELSTGMQVRLLRVLQDRVVQRLGAETALPVKFRLICATHRDLRECVERGRFREDLFYRIHVVHLRVPPLRERHSDIPWLAERMLARQASERGEPPKRLAASARAALLAHDWPGNVRELENRIESAVVLGTGETISADDLFGEAMRAARSEPLPTLEAFVADAERSYIAALLARHQGRVGLVAQILGVSRKTVWEKSKRYGLRAADGETA